MLFAPNNIYLIPFYAAQIYPLNEYLQILHYRCSAPSCSSPEVNGHCGDLSGRGIHSEFINYLRSSSMQIYKLLLLKEILCSHISHLDRRHQASHHNVEAFALCRDLAWRREGCHFHRVFIHLALQKNNALFSISMRLLFT